MSTSDQTTGPFPTSSARQDTRSDFYAKQRSQNMFPPKENNQKQRPWNKGRLVGQKPPLKLKEIWEIRIRLQIDEKHRDLALFNLAIDSKLRACDLLKLRVLDVSQGTR